MAVQSWLYRHQIRWIIWHSEKLIPSLAVRMSACRNTVVPISSSLCVLKRCKLWFLLLSHSPLTFTRKETKYKLFLNIILWYFRVWYSKTTKFLHLVHNEIRWRQDSTVLAAVRTAGASAVCKEVLAGAIIGDGDRKRGVHAKPSKKTNVLFLAKIAPSSTS